MNIHEFVPVKGYEGFYEINRKGEIRRVGKKKLLTQYVIEDRYVVVKMSINNKGKQERVHRLMGRTFLRELKKGEGYYHRNGMITDNFINNIVIKKRSDFLTAVAKTGTRRIAVVQLDENNNIINSFRSIKEAAKQLFISKAQVMERLNNKLKTNPPPYLRREDMRCYK